jgi:biotin operon repressor/predicted transcriptional regulator
LPNTFGQSKEEPRVIIAQELKKEQLERRLRLKSAEEAFMQIITSGTNCSPMEAQIIVEKAKEVFAVGEHAEGNVLLDGQEVFFAVAAEAAPGVPIQQCAKRRVVLTHISRAEDLQALHDFGSSAKRQQQILRMAGEAQEQRAYLSQEDLGLLLDCDVRTIRCDIRRLQQRGLTVPTRGTARDIGPGVTHKRKAVELWLSGKESPDVARDLHHSLKAVERYIHTFCRVVYAQRQLRNALKTALVVGISVAGVRGYLDMHRELMGKDEFYRQRLEEVLRIGAEYWEAADGKKNLSPTRQSLGGRR